MYSHNVPQCLILSSSALLAHKIPTEILYMRGDSRYPVISQGLKGKSMSLPDYLRVFLVVRKDFPMVPSHWKTL